MKDANGAMLRVQRLSMCLVGCFASCVARQLKCVALFVCLLIPGMVAGQATPDGAKTDHAERSLAAIDLAIIAAESGIMDVSLEAMKRAVEKGPPVSSVDLGGLLSSNPNPRVRPSPNNPAAEDAVTAQVKLAKRLRRLHDAWIAGQMDPKLAYSAWKGLVLPAGRPNEAFAYSVKEPTSQSITYSNVAFEVDRPETTDCGAAALVQWARLADELEDLRQELARRESLPGAATTVILLNVILAQDESCSVAEAESLCEALTAKTKLLVDDPHAELLFGQVWKMLERLAPDSMARERLVDTVLDATKSHKNWPANEWLKFLVARSLRESLERGQPDEFRRIANLAMSSYDSIRANNADYVASRESAMYGEAAKRAFEAGHVPLGAECLRSQSLLVTNSRYGSSQSMVMLDPTQTVAKKLLTMDRSERYELLNDLVWNMPALGMTEAARMNVTERIPAAFVTQLLGDKWPPSRQIAAHDARSISLLEWALRDALALGKEAEVLDRIATLDKQASDNAKIARLVLALSKDKPLDLSLLINTAEDGTQSLTSALGEGQSTVPLDIAVVEQALAQEDYRKSGEKLLDQLFKTALERRQDLYITWFRKLKFQADAVAGKKVKIHHDLKHWVVTNDVAHGDAMAGRVPDAIWMQRGEDTWGHEFGTQVSYMIFRYPLENDLSISFRSKDGLYQEGGTTFGGLTIEFLRYLKQLRLWGIGNRNMTSVETTAMKEGDFTTYRLTRKGDSLTVHVGDDEFRKELTLISAAFPFFGMCSYHHRWTTYDSLKIEGDIAIPRSVAMLSPSLLGWSTKFKGQRLPEIAFLPDSTPPAPHESDEIEHDWQFADGVLESVNHNALKQDNDSADKPERQEKRGKLTRREALVQYLRPLCDGEEISLEFYHEPGRFSLSPSVGRIAILLSDPEVGLHWITSEPDGSWTGIQHDNRVVDEEAEQLRPIQLQDNDWNRLAVRLDRNVVTLRLNGEDVYRRPWEPDVGRKFGLFHDPTSYHVRARNIQLRGDWPETLPEDLFETQGDKLSPDPVD